MIGLLLLFLAVNAIGDGSRQPARRGRPKGRGRRRTRGSPWGEGAYGD